MRQTRLSIGCQDWQKITAKIGPAATGVLLYLRLTMRNMQASEITISTAELAEALKLDAETVGNLLCMILDAELLDAVPGPDGLTTYQNKEEAAALAERFRKRMQKLKRKAPEIRERGKSATDENSGQQAEIAPAHEQKEYTTDVLMVYDANDAGNSRYTLFDKNERTMEKEKETHTPEKEKSLTEHPRARTSTPAPMREAELPSDQLESDYIDIVGRWPNSLREALMAESADVREAFYLFVRTRQKEEGRDWSSDRVRIAWLAARRITVERRADSILAAAMGNWKTIRDCGSGVYFERETGRVVSLVRGPVQAQHPHGGTTSAAALGFLKTMREE